MKRVFRLSFSEQIVTDDNIVVKEKPELLAQICEQEGAISRSLAPEAVISQMMLTQAYEVLKEKLENDNRSFEEKCINRYSDVSRNETFEPIIIPLTPQNLV